MHAIRSGVVDPSVSARYPGIGGHDRQITAIGQTGPLRFGGRDDA